MVSSRSSLRRRLPAGIALILAIAITTFGALAYSAARRETERSVWVRLQSVADRFSQLTRPGLATRLDRVRSVAGDARVVAVLGSGAPPESAIAALSVLGPDTGGTVAVGLRDRAGTTVRSLNRTLLPAPPEGLLTPDSAYTGPLFLRGEHVEFETVAPVRRGRTLLGQVVLLRRIRSNTSTVQTLNELMGPGAVLLFGNRDGSLWSDLIRAVERPPITGDSITYARGGDTWMLRARPILDSPFSIAVELPHRAVFASMAPLLWSFGVTAAIVVAVAAVAGWLLTRRVTDPLIRLTAAAEAITAGEGGTGHAREARDDEVGRLEQAFAVMSESVQRSREDLERQVSERTAQLERTQAELIRREKMAVLGQLASSVGHELRNPLGVMANIHYYLNATLTAAPARAREHLDMLKRQIGLAEKIVSDILDFTRLKEPDARELSVADFVDEQLQRVAVPPKITVNQEIAPNLPAVRVDPVQIGQVLFNILTNAVQAMDPDGGVLTVRGVQYNGVVRIEVTDQGPGVPDDCRERVFEPLFTTKQRGIGLGLSVSRSLAEANGGNLAVGSQEQPGGIFWLDLPAVRAT
ncbi:MAG: sensor histidine kinase [Gemmatimonadaceae bacterium]